MVFKVKNFDKFSFSYIKFVVNDLKMFDLVQSQNFSKNREIMSRNNSNLSLISLHKNIIFMLSINVVYNRESFNGQRFRNNTFVNYLFLYMI